jgi:hypothetical protein
LENGEEGPISTTWYRIGIMMRIEEKWKEQLAQIVWDDASLERILCEYDSVTVHVLEHTGRRVAVKVLGHIAVEWSGHWDENIIDACTVSERTPYVEDALQSITDRYGKNPTLGGGTRVFEGPWFEVLIEMLDGASVRLVGQDLRVQEKSAT